jgi:hypothetical protein
MDAPGAVGMRGIRDAAGGTLGALRGGEALTTDHDGLLVGMEFATSLSTTRVANDAGVENRELGTRPDLAICPASPTMEGPCIKKAPWEGAGAPSVSGFLRPVVAVATTGKV